MIILNGKNFALNDDEFCNSLFQQSGTCVGYYKVNKKSVSLMDIHKNKIGVIANNVLASATKLDNGKYWYSYATIKQIGEYSSYSQEQKEIREVMSLIK